MMMTTLMMKYQMKNLTRWKMLMLKITSERKEDQRNLLKTRIKNEKEKM
jgi:hypothetical protein